ncbi:hypothetical protein SAMN05446589_8946 [Streptomyces sp. OV198]|nr:hypothetical protein SAMN05446589_8946 [Streptomyces sp. OV198]
MSLLHHDARSEALAQLSCFRGEFYSCLTARSDALFELAEAVLCGAMLRTCGSAPLEDARRAYLPE